MNPPENNDPIEVLLQEQNNYIEDNGFTARVISSLPRRPASFWLRPLVLLLAAGVGIILAVLWLPWKNLPALDSSALLTLDTKTLAPWIIVFSVVLSLVWAIVAALGFED